MFFVGATGQLLTLILTVSLPFIFYLSGHQKVNIEQPVLSFGTQQNVLEISPVDFYSFEFNQIFATETEDKSIAREILGIVTIPSYNHRIPPNWFRLNYSGNKAPPLFL